MIEWLANIFGLSYTIMSIISFVIAAIVTVLAGIKLTKYGDAIAEKTTLGHSIVGIVLLAAATSLPELITTSTASVMGNPQLALGNIFGSNMFNLFIVFILDFLTKDKPMFSTVHQKNLMIGGTVICLTSVALAGIVIPLIEPSFTKYITLFGRVSSFSVAILVVYFILMYFIYKKEKQIQKEEGASEEQDSEYDNMTKKEAILGYLISAAVIVMSGIVLSVSADGIAAIKVGGTELGGTFIGTLLLAFCTSLPELIVTWSAVKLGQYDMALGNLFGSNLFNITIIFFADLFYKKGLFSDIPTLKTSLVPAILGMIFIGIAITGIGYKSKNKLWRFSFDSTAIGILYILGILFIYLIRGIV